MKHKLPNQHRPIQNLKRTRIIRTNDVQKWNLKLENNLISLIIKEQWLCPERTQILQSNKYILEGCVPSSVIFSVYGIISLKSSELFSHVTFIILFVQCCAFMMEQSRSKKEGRSILENRLLNGKKKKKKKRQDGSMCKSPTLYHEPRPMCLAPNIH